MNQWSDLNPSPTPPGRNFPGIAYDSQSDRVVVFGGCAGFESNCVDETWSFDYNALPRPPADFRIAAIVAAVAAAVVVAVLLLWRSRRQRKKG